MRFIVLDLSTEEAVFNAMPGDTIRTTGSFAPGTVNLPTGAPAGSVVTVASLEASVSVLLGTGETMYGAGSSVTGGGAWRYTADGEGTWLAYRGSLS